MKTADEFNSVSLSAINTTKTKIFSLKTHLKSTRYCYHNKQSGVHARTALGPELVIAALYKSGSTSSGTSSSSSSSSWSSSSWSSGNSNSNTMLL